MDMRRKHHFLNMAKRNEAGCECKFSFVTAEGELSFDVSDLQDYFKYSGFKAVPSYLQHLDEVKRVGFG